MTGLYITTENFDFEFESSCIFSRYVLTEIVYWVWAWRPMHHIWPYHNCDSKCLTEKKTTKVANEEGGA